VVNGSCVVGAAGSTSYAPNSAARARKVRVQTQLQRTLPDQLTWPDTFLDAWRK